VHSLITSSSLPVLTKTKLLRFSEIPQEKPLTSAPVIQHPDQADMPAYKVQILQAAPSPLPMTASNTPAASHVPTPRSESIPAERILTVSEITSIFIKSLVRSAEDFLGNEVHGAVISVPSWFDDAQRAALEKASEDAGIKVLQLLDDAGAVAATTTSGIQPDGLSPDRNQLVVDLGSSSLELSLLSIRQGLAHCLASSSDSTVGGDRIDDKLIKFFAKEFTKRTKTPLTLCPATDPLDKRAEAKLRLAVEHTKRTISASSGAATCSVESLKDGMDFTGSINRMRFDMEVRSIYDQVATQAKALVESAGLDLYDVDEIVYVGGSASLPGLDETLVGSGFAENLWTPFRAGTVVGGGNGDPTTVLARGCAMQGMLLASLGSEQKGHGDVRGAFRDGSEMRAVRTLSKTLGMLFPEDSASEGDLRLGGQWIEVVKKETALPCRRTVRFGVEVGEGGGKVGFEIWEVREGVKVEMVKPPKVELDEGEEEEEEEEDIEVKEKTVDKERCLGSVCFEAKEAAKDKGRWKTTLEVEFLVGKEGGLEVGAWEVGKNGRGEKVSVVVPSP
jgi:heat shock protein 1/8